MNLGPAPTPALPRKGGGSYAEIAAALSLYGLILRGGFHPAPGEAGLEGAGTVLLIGNAGAAMWEAFAPYIDGRPDPLNRWTERIIGPLADRFGARAVYPFGDGALPFQRWALRAATVYPSPLGILIDPEYGLWHAYRAALLFPKRLPLPPRSVRASPCETCVGKPCLSACPVGAFSAGVYNVAACAAHLGTGDGADCRDSGCHARNACPVGAEWRYPEAQIRFHMAAFAHAMSRVNAIGEEG